MGKMNWAARATRKIVSAGSLSALALLSGTVFGIQAQAEPLKVGFVYVSPIGDAGWTFQHETGRQALTAALGPKVATRFVDKVPEGAEAERVIRQFARDGYDLIFTTSFGYMNPTIKVAKRFPKIAFEHATGYKRAANVGTFNVRFYEGRYLAGLIAGSQSKTGVAGYVAAFPIPEVVMGINAFTRGMRASNPDAEMRVVWVNSWYDPGREREAAAALIAQGADVVTHHTDSTAVVQTAEEKGVLAVGYHSDMSKYGPNAHLAAVTHHWGAHYIKVAKAVRAGTWQPSNVWGGMKDGMVKIEAIHERVPATVVARVREAEDRLRAGTFHPFAGPVVDNTGVVRVPAGSVITDEALSQMNYYVEGVRGSLRK